MKNSASNVHPNWQDSTQFTKAFSKMLLLSFLIYPAVSTATFATFPVQYNCLLCHRCWLPSPCVGADIVELCGAPPFALSTPTTV